MNQELIEIKSCGEPGYHPLVYFGGWRVAFLNDTARFHLEQIREMQRHNTSDEVFLLIQGSCTLYVAAALESGIGEITAVELELAGCTMSGKVSGIRMSPDLELKSLSLRMRTSHRTIRS